MKKNLFAIEDVTSGLWADMKKKNQYGFFSVDKAKFSQVQCKSGESEIFLCAETRAAS